MVFVVYPLMSTIDGNQCLFDDHPVVAAEETGQAYAVGNRQESSAVFYSITAEPAKVAAGDMIRIKAVFSVSADTSRSALPVSYFYEIRKQNMLMYQSPAKKMNADIGAKTVLDIRVQAAGEKGDYKMILKLKYSDGTARADTDFSIVSPEEASLYAYKAGRPQEAEASGNGIEERLPGKWRFESSDSETPGTELTISKENDELVARMSRKNTRTLWVRLRTNEKNLILRSKLADTTGGCWYVVEDVIAINDRMDNMPVRSRILEGSACVSIGRITTSMLRRVR